MDFICQQGSLIELKNLSKSKKSSIIISGVEGCGKTYLAKQYANMLNITNFQIINPIVSDLRDTIDSCYTIKNDIVICIENLDTGVIASSYTILKFLEEPMEHVYIVVTCRDINRVPDTILSRSFQISVCVPTDKDIQNYIQSKYPNAYNIIYNKKPQLINCLRTFSDADVLCNLSEDKLDYIINLKHLDIYKQPVKTIVWSMEHFPDNTECPLNIVIKYIADISNSEIIKQSSLNRLKELAQNRIAKYQILTRFIYDIKILT